MAKMEYIIIFAITLNSYEPRKRGEAAMKKTSAKRRRYPFFSCRDL
jgi:hypothetical protein